MSEQQEQAVANEADTQTPVEPATPGNEAEGAQEEQSLSELLAEFDADKTAPTPDQAVTQQGPDTALLDEVNTLKATVADMQFKGDISPVIDALKAELPEGVLRDEQILDLVDGMARREPKLQDAWNNRKTNPSGWNKVVKGVGRELSKQFKGIPDAQLTEDREAVTAAVRGSSKPAPGDGPAPDYSQASDQEFRATVQKEYGFTPL